MQEWKDHWEEGEEVLRVIDPAPMRRSCLQQALLADFLYPSPHHAQVSNAVSLASVQGPQGNIVGQRRPETN